MSFLSAGDIASMRTTIETGTLAGTATVQRFTSVSDPEGGQTNTYTNSGTAACHISPVSGTEALEAGRVTADTQWVLTLPNGTDVNAKDRVVVAGTTYEVDAVRAPRTWELARRVYVHQIG